MWETHELSYGKCDSGEQADDSRGGKAVRLTYDHKGSDSHEAKRITDAGGFVMNNRVNGEFV
jgi:serine/threonine protein phosphatase PrpC